MIHGSHYIDQAWPAGENGFRRGSYGEILPPPLVTGLASGDLAGLLLELIGDEAISDRISAHPTEFYRQITLGYAHQQRLLQTLAGQCNGPDATALYRAVMQGEPLSLRPLGHEGVTYRTFAPILQRIGVDRWRLGLPTCGRWLELAGPPAVVWRRARQVYGMWAEAEASRFTATPAALPARDGGSTAI